MKNRRFIPIIVYLLLMVAAMSWAMGIFDHAGNDLPYSEVVELFRQEQVKRFVVEDHLR